jgi:hypothetical protein
MQSGRPGRPMAGTAETAKLVDAIQLDQIVSGNTSLRFVVK